MATFDDRPTFNLKAVMLETGLKPDTLRAWERRYGLPQPQRTAGRHRVYSQRDIDTIRWLISRQDEGLSISRAVALWHRLQAAGQDPLTDPTYGIPESPTISAFVPEGKAIDDLRQAWLAACKEFDEQKADHVLTFAFALYPAETVCLEILLAGLGAIGDGWYRGEASVQQEHFVSELAMRRLEAMVAATPGATRAGRILVGCAPEDEHTFVPLLLTFMLRQRGWEVVYLGARVPAARMEATVTKIRPRLVILTAQQLHTAASVLEIAGPLQRVQVPLAFGGRVFNLEPQLRHRIPGHFLGEQLQAAPRVVEQLLTASPSWPPTESPSAAYQEALTNFRELQMLIEAEMLREMGSTEISPNHLSIANEAIARNVAAALQLGNINFLCTDIEWVEGLLHNYSVPKQLLRQYLRAYHQAAQEHLGDSGDIVLGCLARLSEAETKPKA